MKSIPNPFLFPPMKIPRVKIGLLKRFFQKFDQKELIAVLGCLQIFPENDFHATRLEFATQIAYSINGSKQKRIDPNEFKNRLNEYIPTISNIGITEKPPENPFTNLLGFCGKDYIIYPDVYDDESLIIDHLYTVITSQNEKFPDEFLQETLSKIFGILWISNEIATRVGHIRYMDCPHDWTSKPNDIYVPIIKEIKKFQNAVVFDKKILAKELGAIYLSLEPFISHKTGKKNEYEETEKTSLFISPLVDFGDEIVVSLPRTLLASLRHNIWKTAIKFNILNELAFEYQQFLWYNSWKFFNYMGYKFIDEELPAKKENFPVDEGLFTFDTDKIAYVQLISDSAENYNVNDIKSEWKFAQLPDKIYNRDLQIIDFLTHEKPSFANIFLIKIFGNIGRNAKIPIKNIDNTRMLLISYEDLKIVSESLKCDKLTLWKYCKAEQDIKDYIRFFPPSFLDKFAFFLKYNTLMPPNKILSNILLIPQGFGKDFRYEIIRKHDRHLIPLGEPEFFVTVYNADLDPKILIYQPEQIIWDRISLVIEGYYQPIWIVFDEDLHNLQQLDDFYAMDDLIKSVAYWIWQLTPKLKEYLKPLGVKPLHISIKFEDRDFWRNNISGLVKPEIEKDYFKYYIQERYLHLIIPNFFFNSLKGSDNSGDRVLIKNILSLISIFLKKEGLLLKFYEDVIDRIIDECVPLGKKKKFFQICPTVEGLLIKNKNFPFPRVLQLSDIQGQSLWIIDNLQITVTKNGIIRGNQSEICKKITKKYYQKLKLELTKFHWRDLLEYLIGMNDSLSNKATEMIFFNPFIIECYSNENEIIKKMGEDIPIIDKTGLCFRTLIEIIAAEPPHGKNPVSLDEMDRIMAIVHHFTEWANISDFYYHKILTSELIIQSGGRIQLPYDQLGREFSDFIEEKARESVEFSFDRFKDEFEVKRPKKVVKKDEIFSDVESACIAEFGLGTKEMSYFFLCLVQSTKIFICPEQEGPVFSLPINEFKNRIKAQMGWDDDKVNRAIKEFSLKPRKAWHIPPKGFTLADIVPWKYRRRLAHARRPLIIGPGPKGNPDILWGSLQSESSLKYLFNLVDDARYDTTFASKVMKSFIKKIQKNQGDNFTAYVEKWFKENTQLKILLPNRVLKNKNEATGVKENLGDIDICAIDEPNGIILSIECKKINFGRNAREIANELVRFYEDSDDKKSWISKHKKRHEWIKSNTEKFVKQFSLKNQEYKIRSIILTSEAIPTMFFHDIDPEIPIISFNKVYRDGFGVIKQIL